jgi:putative redox protein
MVTMQFEYQGDLHCRAVHGPSGTELNTDAPTDNQGRGESFSPTDLVATALGTCMLTVMGIAARTLNIDIAGTKATVEKEMTTAFPRRIARLASSEPPTPAPCTRACTLTSRPQSNLLGNKLK